MTLKKKIFILLLILTPEIAYAYLGMGPILPVIGSALVFIFLIVIGIFGIFFYPIKKLMQKKRGNTNKNNYKDNKK